MFTFLRDVYNRSMKNINITKARFGYSRIVEPTGSKQTLDLFFAEDIQQMKIRFMCLEKFVVLSIDGKPHLLNEGEELILNAFTRSDIETVSFESMGDGRLLIQVEYLEETIPQENLEKESDISLAYRVAFSRMPGARKFVKSIEGTWFDRVMQSDLNALSHMHVPGFIFAAGLAILYAFVAKPLPAMALWTGLFVLVVNPLMYYMVLPKPIGRHIRPVEELTPHEFELYLEDEKDVRTAS